MRLKNGKYLFFFALFENDLLKFIVAHKCILSNKNYIQSMAYRSSARYIGALVGDVHNVLINGGIYGYPGTKSNPSGKLRLLYESNPMGMILEQAGGAASTGYGRILDVQPTEVHMRVPTFLGSIENVFELDQFHQYYPNEEDGN